VPIDVLAEAIVRVREELLEPATLADALARSHALLEIGDLPERLEAAVEGGNPPPAS
jgi:hypothetical protein